ncbi:rhomboid family intramembrane serine protease [Pseudonocardia petroleophila]|uniref:Rhomboid family intramembrane serine protease n=1 Tax=Pseudonocardia petroleophila TaxID=37331 RepID=A0A7G7MJG1_9PSEU|nr:rhomboid family intramembrane serine protease [Pseudonocardia petroleophila]QNG52922.1 rhomboid family intramembrane serine protease [Pseudonocardia petroleophila]
MTAPAPRRTIGRVLPAAPGRSAVTMLVFAAFLYAVEVADVVSGQTLQYNGIVPRDTGDLDGILWAPLLHDDWAHLAANTIPFLVFGFLAMAGGIRQFVLVTATIWLLGGLGVWLTGDDNSYHIGASGLVFGWLAFLLTRGFFARSGRQIAVAVVLFLVWGGVLFGVLPGQPGISWQAHLFGALAGVLAAWLVARADRPEPALPGT